MARITQRLTSIRQTSGLRKIPSAQKRLRKRFSISRSTKNDAENGNRGSDVYKAGTKSQKHGTEESGPSAERTELSSETGNPPEENAGNSSPTRKTSTSSKRNSTQTLPIPSIGGVALESPKKFPFFASPFGVLNAKRKTDSESSKVFQGRLTGRKCLVTGGTSGIGYAIAKSFLLEGAASVATISRSQEKVDEAYRRMKQDLKMETPPFHFIMGDITDLDFRRRMLEKNFHLANLDILVNAAGISQSSLNMVTSWEAIQQIIDTNLSATIALCKMFCRLNLPRSRLPSGKPSNFSEVPLRNLDETSREDSVAANPGSLCIINISSLLGIKGGFGATAYAASKAGVLGFTRALVCEHGKEAINNVRVNALVPGYINTPMTQALLPNVQQGFLKQIPLDRFGTVEEVADAAVFLASNEYANNCVLNLDGGLSAM